MRETPIQAPQSSIVQVTSTFPRAEDLYPESDGRPMAETDLHQEWMWKLKQIFKYRYRDQNVYVASDLLVYYEENVPARFVVPDVFVVLNCDPSMRRVYKMWSDGGPPTCVIEVTSQSTRREDELLKPTTYRNIGVKEYILYDPTADYLDPSLQGHRLDSDGLYEPIPLENGSLICDSLGLRLTLDDRDLVITDLETGEIQMMREDAEANLRQKAEDRIRELEAELQRLRRD
ncbi:MAG: Uma2 family endonuclease [Planctomycetota bacterium]